MYFNCLPDFSLFSGSTHLSLSDGSTHLSLSDGSTHLSLFDFTTNLLASSVDRRFFTTGRTPENFWEIIIPPFRSFPRPLAIYFSSYPEEYGMLHWFDISRGAMPEVPAFDPNKIGYPFSFYIYQSGGGTRGVYLPDELSEKLQLFINHWYDHDIFYQIQFYTFYVVYFFKEILDIRLFLFWFLQINPYQMPLAIMMYMSDWAIGLFEFLFPSTVGVNMGGTILTSLLGALITFLSKLVLTIPYLPSEGITYAPPIVFKNAKERGLDIKDLPFVPYTDVKDNKDLRKFLETENQIIRVFTGFPKLYTNNPIPNWLREYWWANERHVPQDLMEKKSDFLYENDIKILPDRIEEEIRRTGEPMSYDK